MKSQRHRHKESFSLLLISHTNGSSRQFHVSLTLCRLLLALLLLVCAALIGLTLWSATGFSRARTLGAQLASQQQLIEQLEAEKERLNEEKQALVRENGLLQLTAMAGKAKGSSGGEEDAGADPTFPSLYPSSDSGMLISTYTEDVPYLSLSTHQEDQIIAAGDGTITSVTSDDTYPLIIEISHESGYRTRYMCRQSAQLQVQENAAVKAGEPLLIITTDNTQLDYQVIFENKPIDPFNVIDAKG